MHSLPRYACGVRRTRSASLVGFADIVGRVVPVVPGFLCRHHRAAFDPRRSGGARGGIAVGGGGVRDRICGLADHRGTAGRHLWAQACVPAGYGRLCIGLGVVRTGGEPDDADRLARSAGGDGGGVDPASTGDHPHHVRTTGAGVCDRTLWYVDGVCLDRGAGGGWVVGQPGSVRVVVAADLPDQRADRVAGDRCWRAGVAGVTDGAAPFAGSGRRGAGFSGVGVAGLSAGGGAGSGVARLVIRDAGCIGAGAGWFHLVRTARGAPGANSVGGVASVPGSGASRSAWSFRRCSSPGWACSLLC